jgi:hypothetical protein
MKHFLNISAWGACAAGLFDVFGESGPVVRLGTLADDVARVGDDFRAVGEEFAAILARHGGGGPHD